MDWVTVSRLPALVGFILFSWLAVAGAPAQDSEPSRPLTELIAEFWRSGGQKECEKAIGAVLSAESDVSRLEAILRDEVAFESKDPGLRTESLSLPSLDKNLAVPLFVPNSYDPSQKSGLFLFLHGMHGNGLPWAQKFQDLAEAQRLIILAPTDPDPSLGWTFKPEQREFHVDVLRWARREFNVDDDRIFVGGVSRGGHGTWDLALEHPHTFAGAVALIGGPRLRQLRYLENVRALPILDLQGAKDDPRLVANIREVMKQLEDWEADARYIEFPNLGHSFDLEAADLPTWMGARTRDPYPANVTLVTSSVPARSSWLEITKVAKGAKDPKKLRIEGYGKMNEEQRRKAVLDTWAKHVARIEARITEEGVVIEASQAKKVSLYLHPKLVPFGKSLPILVNGKQRKKVTPRASAKTLLREAWKSGDRSALTTYKVTVSL